VAGGSHRMADVACALGRAAAALEADLRRYVGRPRQGTGAPDERQVARRDPKRVAIGERGGSGHDDGGDRRAAEAGAAAHALRGGGRAVHEDGAVAVGSGDAHRSSGGGGSKPQAHGAGAVGQAGREGQSPAARETRRITPAEALPAAFGRGASSSGEPASEGAKRKRRRSDGNSAHESGDRGRWSEDEGQEPPASPWAPLDCLFDVTAALARSCQ
jgi:hypothetical protein